MLRPSMTCCACCAWCGAAVQYDDSHRESLLNSTNAKRAQQTLNNLRMSCNVAGNCVLQVRLSWQAMRG